MIIIIIKRIVNSLKLLLIKELSKGLIEIAYALNHSKDLKDLFVDLIELVSDIYFNNYCLKKER